MRTIPVGLLGLGNVGSRRGQAARRQRRGHPPAPRRRGRRHRARSPCARPTSRASSTSTRRSSPPTSTRVLDDPEIQIVVELIGGEEPARALRARRHRARQARRHRQQGAPRARTATSSSRRRPSAASTSTTRRRWAAACPIIRALREGLASDRVDELVGHRQRHVELPAHHDDRRGRGRSPRSSRRRRSKGYAEADPSLDVDGWDAAHKLCVLVPLCFGTRIRVEQVLVEGLRGIEPDRLPLRRALRLRHQAAGDRQGPRRLASRRACTRR